LNHDKSLNCIKQNNIFCLGQYSTRCTQGWKSQQSYSNIREIFNQVGGIQERREDEILKLSSTSDHDALRIGPPCKSDAKQKADCVHVLNIYASALMVPLLEEH